VRYQRVDSERELLDGLSQPGAAILCGGTDVIVKMRAGIMRPEILFDIARLESLRGIRVEGSNLEIGAATLESDVLHSSLVGEHVPLLGSVLRQLGSVQIRNRGTLGGNIVNASPAADGAIPLLLYDTEILLVGANGERWVRLEDFFIGPGRTTLESGEFVRTLRLPIPADGFNMFFHKVGKRNALTIAIASLGTLLRLKGDVIDDLRVAVGSVAPTPKRLREIENRLIGRTLDDSTISEARELVVQAISPISDVRASAGYRKNVIGDLLVRALQSRLAGS
jgi:CO/xanthine dehydrogenase FAD-binding subunit